VGEPKLTEAQKRALERGVFIAGYLAAIADLERTGLRPTTPRTCRESAERAWRAQHPDRGREVLADG